MSEVRLASIIVNNYNYGRFLHEAADSAINQSYPNIEVIVVDDGSTDRSREIIAGYGDRIVPVLKENGGQTSAFNEGFRLSRGDVILFLDADDTLLPTALEKAVNFFLEGNVAKVHWPLWEVDTHGRKTGKLTPRDNLVEGDLREILVRDGPEAYVTPPTTGNAWARKFLERVFPLPEVERSVFGARRLSAPSWGQFHADLYLSTLAPLFGRIRKIAEPLGHYRLHGQNTYSRLTFDEKLEEDLWCYDDRCRMLSAYCREMGIDVDPEIWKRNSWLHRFTVAREEIAALVAPGETLVLVDEAEVGSEVAAGRRAVPFLEHDGQYWGDPPDDPTAIRELERLRRSGASFIVFAWPAFWWFEYYTELHRYLRSTFRCILENDRLVVFDLRERPGRIRLI